MTLARVGLVEGSDVNLVMLRFQYTSIHTNINGLRQTGSLLHTEGPDDKCEVLTEEVLGEIGVRV